MVIYAILVVLILLGITLAMYKTSDEELRHDE